jgi:hypothetical protein
MNENRATSQASKVNMLPTAHRALAPLSPRIDTTARPRATLANAAARLVVAAGVLLGPAWPTRAQPDLPGAGSEEIPTPARVMNAYRSARGAVDVWSTDNLQPVPGVAHGCFVLLRAEGRVLGSGGAMWAGPQPAGATLKAALDEAMGEADRGAPIPRDLLRPERLAELGRQSAISLELAGPLTPVWPVSLEELDVLLRPGLDGLAVERAGQIRGISPGQMLARGRLPTDAARGLIAEMVGSAEVAMERMEVLRDKHDVRLYKFTTVHAAQGGAGREPALLVRGARPIKRTDIDSGPELQFWAAQVAAALARRIDPASGAFRGGAYRLDTGDFEADESDPARPLLAALALVRFAEMRERTQGPDDGASRAARRSAQALVERAAARATGATEAAMALVAMGPGTPDAQRLLEKVRDAVEKPGDARPGVRALWTLALIRGGRDREQARLALDAVLASSPPGEQIEMWPWIVWACAELSTNGATIPASTALREARAAARSCQLSPMTMLDQPDLRGGFVAGGGEGGSRWPTWTTARIASALPAMLKHADLTTKAELGPEMLTTLDALRFLRQLTADDSAAWMCRAPEQAEGMVRLAPWEVRAGSDAGALTLIAVCDLIMVFEDMRAGTPGTTGPKPGRR